MSEDRKKTYRLFKVSAELNVAIDTLADALREKGFEAVDSSDPNAKITSDMYEFLVNKYAQDKQSKEKAARQKQAQKEQSVARIRKPLQPLDDSEPFESSPLTAIELRQKLSQQAAEPVTLRPLVTEPETAPPRRPDAPLPEESNPPGSLTLDLPPLPDFVTRTPEPAAPEPAAFVEPAEAPAPQPEAIAPTPPTEARELAPAQPQAPTEPAAPEAVPPPEPAPFVEPSQAITPQPEAITPSPPTEARELAPAQPQAPTEPAPFVEPTQASTPQPEPRTEKAETTKPAGAEPAPSVQAPAPQVTEAALTPAEPLQPEETPPSEPPLFKTTPPSIGLKVVGKVDLDQMEPRRGKRKTEAKAEQKPEARDERKLKSKTEPTPQPAPKSEPKAGPEPRKPEPRTAPPAPKETAPAPVMDTPEPPKASPPPPAPEPPIPAAEPLPAKLAPAAEVADKVEAEEPSVIRASDHAPKLSGLKIMGKIDLTADMVGRRSLRSDKDKEKDRDKTKPAEPVKAASPPPATVSSSTAAAGSATDAEKRKRKRKRKGAAPEATTSPTTRTTLRPPSSKPAAGAGKTTTSKASETTKKEAASNLRNTLGAIGRTAPRKRQNIRKEKRTQRANIRQQQFEQELADANILEVTEYLTANELASLMDVSVNEVIGKCMELGMIVSINQRINAEVISLIAEEFGYEVKFVSVDEAFAAEDEEQDEPENLEPRHPIVTVMGHVDHGKTSLLDYIRKTNVIKGEAGGITQHIGAYEVKLPDGRRITFLDTPGHEAFTAMRARGAQVTDIAIIVIAADDQIMPQTREAINHAQAAGVKMVFAINKIDKEGAKPDVIRQQLAEMNLLVEDWGGPYQCQEISAKQGIGIEDLLEKVLLEAELLELKANPNRPARGTVIEAQLDRGRGVVATLLVQTGTLNVGDIVVANCNYGRIKAMFDDRQKKIKKAGPSTPVLILGLDGVPQAGDKFQVMESDREARELATRRQQLMREQTIRMHKNITLEEIARRSALGDFQELNVIVKGDVDGSVEALADSLIKLSTDEVAVKIIMKGVGEISESDVLLASASNAIIVGFQVRPSANARKLIQQESVDVRLYSVIYNAINEIKDALEGLLKPTIEEEVLGVAQVRETFRVAKVGTIAGCMVTEGKINRNNPVRIIRDGIVQYTGKIESLRRFKDDVREVAEGFECGISIENFNDIKIGDLIEAYTTKEIKRTID